MHPDVKTLLQSGAQLTDAALERLLPSPDTLPHSIHRAMRHSIFAGGKRVRPILCMEAARMVAGGTEIPAGAADLGAALEMIHTYSLIHDDLPALDNDHLPRRHPTPPTRSRPSHPNPRGRRPPDPRLPDPRRPTDTTGHNRGHPPRGFAR